MGKRSKKQADPPTLDEFQGIAPAKKRKTSSKKTSDPKKSSKSSQKKVEKERKTLFEDSDSAPDLVDEEEAEEEFYDSDEPEVNDKKSTFSDDDEDLDVLERANAKVIEGFESEDDEEEESEDEMEDDEFAFSSDDSELEEGEEDELVEENPRAKVLPSEEETGMDEHIASIRTRIQEVVKVLEDFKNLAEEGRSRAEYVAQLHRDVCKYYGYSEYLAEKFLDLFSPAEAIEFFDANEVVRPVIIRTNTLKARRSDLRQALINRGVNVEHVKWSNVGMQVFDSQVPIGATPEYLAGHYILQAASSFLPVMALQAQEGERILDMASAPGGKSTYIAAMMKNTGCLFANDSNKARTKALVANIHRLGCTNTIVCNYDAREFPKVIGGFDRILLDAPCSGTGVISKDKAVKTNRTEKDFIQLPHLQKQLLLSAIDSVDAHSKTGGIIVYSTCSVMVEENEAVVDYVLRKRPNVELVDTELPIGKEGFASFRGKKFHPSVKLTRRYYPHTYNVDGFYVAKFRKTAPSPHDNSKAGAKEKEQRAREEDNVEPIINDDFATFDNEEDQELVERARRRSMRKKGLKPTPSKK